MSTEAGEDHDGSASVDGGTTGDGGATATLTVVVTGTTTSGVIASNVGGLTCPGTCALTLPIGSTVTLTSAAPADVSLVSWSGGGCVGRELSCTIAVDGPKTVTVGYATLEHFVHSSTRLYRMNGATGAATAVADFGGGCAPVSVGDIALDRTGTMWAISLGSSLFTVEPKTAVCSAAIGSLGRSCNGLAVAPDSTDPAADVLYAGCGTSLYRVSTTTGATTLVGSFGGGWSSSGDLVWVPGSGLFGTFQAGGNDRLGKVNSATGAVTIVGDTGVTSLWGLGYRAGKILAFSTSTLSLDLASGAATTVNASLGLTAYGGASGP